MKITIKKTRPEVKPVYIKDVPLGHVFEVGYGDKCLKLEDDNVVMLQFNSGDNWFGLKDDTSWEDEPIKVLGKLTEIIVEE